MAQHVIDAARRIDETILLTGRSILPVKLRIFVNIGKVAASGKAALKKLQEVSDKLATSDDDENAFASFGVEYVAACETIIGKENTDRIVKYFGGEILEMAAAITPFLVDVIIPQLQLGDKKAARATVQHGKSRGALSFRK